MKGFTLTRDFLIKLIIVIVVMAVIIGMVAVFIRPATEETSLRVQIQRLCANWVSKSCDMNEAAFIFVNDGSSLAALCQKDFKSSAWDVPTWEHCKSICLGCPK